MTTELNLTVFKKYLWQEPNLLVVLIDTPKLSTSRGVYNQRYGIEGYREDSERNLAQALTAVGLASFSLADPESWGWSLSVPGSKDGYFIGAEPEGMLCGRVVPSDVDADGSVIQRQKGTEPITQSHYTVESTNPVGAIQEYFDKVLQLDTKMAVAADGSGVLFQALPGGTIATVADLDDAALIERARQLEELEELGSLKEAVFFYECRCDQERVNEMLTKLPQDKQEELWGDRTELEIQCPRCGREYIVRKKAINTDDTVN